MVEKQWKDRNSSYLFKFIMNRSVNLSGGWADKPGSAWAWSHKDPPVQRLCKRTGLLFLWIHNRHCCGLDCVPQNPHVKNSHPRNFKMWLWLEVGSLQSDYSNMRTPGRALIPADQCPHKRSRLGYRHTHTHIQMTSWGHRRRRHPRREA